jgi:hypothetical protein
MARRALRQEGLRSTIVRVSTDDEVSEMRTSLRSQEFDQILTLRDSYRIMERFLTDYLARGDTAVSDLLHGYGGLTVTDETSDPAALDDYLAAARQMLVDGKRSGEQYLGG